VKKTGVALTTFLITGALVAGASAQTRPSPAPTRPPGEPQRDTSATATDAKQRQTWTPQAPALETSKLIGTRVKSADGKEAGEIDQLVVNPTDGKITHVILGKGGVLGIGEQKLVLRWSDVKLQHDPDRANRWIAVVDRAKLDSAMRYEARKDDAAPAASPRTSDKVEKK
jgi:sporulation protein YlmC with PRC-barrel domain